MSQGSRLYLLLRSLGYHIQNYWMIDRRLSFLFLGCLQGRGFIMIDVSEYDLEVPNASNAFENSNLPLFTISLKSRQSESKMRDLEGPNRTHELSIGDRWRIGFTRLLDSYEVNEFWQVQCLFWKDHQYFHKCSWSKSSDNILHERYILSDSACQFEVHVPFILLPLVTFLEHKHTIFQNVHQWYYGNTNCIVQLMQTFQMQVNETFRDSQDVSILCCTFREELETLNKIYEKSQHYQQRMYKLHHTYERALEYMEHCSMDDLHFSLTIQRNATKRKLLHYKYELHQLLHSSLDILLRRFVEYERLQYLKYMNTFDAYFLMRYVSFILPIFHS